MIDKSRFPQAGSTYRHYKGGLYRVVAISLHSESLESLVIYETLYDNPKSKYWARPLDMFVGSIEVDGKLVERFAKVEASVNDELPHVSQL